MEAGSINPAVSNLAANNLANGQSANVYNREVDDFPERANLDGVGGVAVRTE